jgi:aldehyde dehydrogenase (NAD+)
VINEILGQIYPPEFIYVALGDESVAKDLLELKFDKIFFTGSTRVGKIIAQKAAMHLTPVTLELGGKSPCIVTDAINLEVTAKRIMWGKFLNAGQTCVAPDYCLVNETIAPAFIDQCKEVIKDFFSDNPSLSQDYGRIVSATHFERLVGLMQGGEVIFGGKSDRDQKFIEPTLIVNPKLDHDLMQEEIFGPLLPIITYKHTDEVFEFISTRESPLALYLFTRDENFKNRVVNEISFGGGCINDTIIHLANPNLPFGGVGASGLGSYHGHKTFLEFSHQKSILEKSIWPDVNIRYAPYKDKTKFLRFFFN